MAYKLKEKFAFYYIKPLLTSDFGRKPQISTIKPSPALAPLASPLQTLGPSTPIPAYTFIYFTPSSGIRFISAAYMWFLKHTLIAYIQASSTILTAYIIQPSGTPSTAYMLPLGTRPPLAIHTQRSGTKITLEVQIPLSVIKISAAITPVRTGHASLIHLPLTITFTSIGYTFLVNLIPRITTTSIGYTPTYTLGFLIVAILLILAWFPSLSVFPKLSALALVNTSPIFLSSHYAQNQHLQFICSHHI